MNKRRETYELEESVAGMNILRTLSDSTFTDIGVDVLPRENSVDFSTSKKVIYENITRRKLLDKPTKELEVANGHNSLINKSSVEQDGVKNNNNSDNNARDVKRSHKQLPFDSSKPSTSRGFLRVHQSNAKKEHLKVASTKIPVLIEIKPELPKDMGLKVAVPEKHKNAEKTRPPKAISLKKVTQFGFKIRSDSCSENKLDQIKAVAAKTKVQQDNRAEQRSILKGVRSNKRFELLMKMRKK
ncbi:hypothetical protein WA026_005202 [Henosepilachna vigintioctopunctata]|uniref:Uncharacterized protein n=1 Tax=Henosepilachna vigintioctopunctata TaxID=420089 RepID=A0AAW1UWC1_9CUCU